MSRAQAAGKGSDRQAGRGHGWQMISLRKLDPARSERADGYIVRPYHPFTRASLLPVEAGHTYRVDVEIFPTEAHLARGHTLRLAIQSSDAPHLTPNAQQTADLAGGLLEIHHDPSHPSWVVLPLGP